MAAAKKRKPMDAMTLAGMPPKRGRPGGMERPLDSEQRAAIRELEVGKGRESEVVSLLLKMVGEGNELAEEYLKAFLPVEDSAQTVNVVQSTEDKTVP